MTDELERLRTGPGTDDPEGFVVSLRAENPDPHRALARMRELLLATIPPMQVVDREAAAAAAPAWFVGQCRPETTPDSTTSAYERLSRMSREELLEYERTKKWPLLGWLNWLDPEDRSWWWWDGRADGPDHLVVDVLTHGHPYGNGPLVWMLRAAGCTDLYEDGESVDYPPPPSRVPWTRRLRWFFTDFRG